jgi:peptide/nickel transport system substrate-binding protein
VDGHHSPGGQEVARTDGVRYAAGGRRFARTAAGGNGLWRLLPLWLGAATGLTLFACSGAPGPAPPREPTTLTVGIPQVSQIDPSRGAETYAGVNSTERMTASDARGRTRPLLLDHWTTSADGLTWRLTLRGGLRFHDGSAVTPADIVRAIDDGRSNPDGMAVCLKDITGVTTIGDRDVEVTLKRRCFYLLDDLLDDVTRPAANGEDKVGTGPFSIASKSEIQVVLAANANYHQGRPAADRVVLRSYGTLREGWADMMRGKLDLLAEVGPDSADFLADQSSVHLRTFVSAYANMLLLNSARPMFRAPGVRRALNLAVDRMALVQLGQKGHGAPATVPTWPNHWAIGGSGRGFQYDPARAGALLVAERAAAGRNSSSPGSPRFEFTCLVPAQFAIIERLALLVQRQLAEVDVRMRIESIQPDALYARMVSGDFDALLLPFLGGPYAWVPYRAWHSPGASKRWNFWGYRSVEMDGALDAMRDARDDAEFTRALRRFESAFATDPPAVLLTWNETIQAVSHRLVVPPEVDGRDAMHFIGKWLLRQPGQERP